MVGFAAQLLFGVMSYLLPTLSSTKIAPAARARWSRALLVHCVGLALAVGLYAVGLTRAAGMAQLLVVLPATSAPSKHNTAPKLISTKRA